jgi:hypothetical protein
MSLSKFINVEQYLVWDLRSSQWWIIRLWSYTIWHCIVWYTCNDSSKEHDNSMLRATTLKIRPVYSSNALVPTYQALWCHFPEEYYPPSRTHARTSDVFESGHIYLKVATYTLWISMRETTISLPPESNDNLLPFTSVFNDIRELVNVVLLRPYNITMQGT